MLISNARFLVIILFCFFTANSLANSSQETSADSPHEWHVSAGFGVLSIPEYEGAEDNETVGVPYISVNYKDQLKFDLLNGLEYGLVNSGPFTAGIGFGIDFGRDESKADILEGIGDIDTSLEPKVYAAYRLGKMLSKITVSADTGGDGHDGSKVDLDFSYLFYLSDKSFLIPSLSFSYGDDDFTQSYFGITAEQSTNSVAGLSEFNAGAGVNNIALNLVYTNNLSKQWSLSAIAQFKSITGDAEDSPLVIESDQAVIGGLLLYKY